jgi:alpha-N-acetylglucosaminidase
VWQTVQYDNRRKGSVYSDATFLQGVRDFLAAADEMKDNKLYKYDAIELASVYLGVKADELYKQALIADSMGNETLKKELGNKAILLLLQADSLLESHATHRLQNWVDYARLHGGNVKLKNYYESNAKRLITTWGGTINDYAARMWSGLIRDYYVPRIKQALFKKDFNRQNWEEQWIKKPGISSIVPYDNPVQKAVELVNQN